MSEHRPGSGERQHVWDNPRNVRLFLRAFYVLCALLLVLDLFVHRHVEHPLERLLGFYPLYGFIAIVALVMLAKQLRRLVMRKEDYYDDLDR